MPDSRYLFPGYLLSKLFTLLHSISVVLRILQTWSSIYGVVKSFSLLSNVQLPVEIIVYVIFVVIFMRLVSLCPARAHFQYFYNDLLFSAFQQLWCSGVTRWGARGALPHPCCPAPPTRPAAKLYFNNTTWSCNI